VNATATDTKVCVTIRNGGGVQFVGCHWGICPREEADQFDTEAEANEAIKNAKNISLYGPKVEEVWR